MMKLKNNVVGLSSALLLGCMAGNVSAADTATKYGPGKMPANDLAAWPSIQSVIGKDPAIEAKVAAIVAGMTLEQKIGQMTQPEIKSITPDDVRRYYLGSVLNGGGSWPDRDNKRGSAADWVALADKYYAASMATDMPVKIPVIWGIDAIHGNSNVYGATLFPHNIGLGAARNPQLVGQIGRSMGKSVRATGIAWVFGPTIAVVRDDRWGRTYESFSEDSALVRQYAGEYVKGLQGSFMDEANVVATAKHFMGDGGTDQGKDRGVNLSTNAQMLNTHAQGYLTALATGAQTVMASYNSWNDKAAGANYGKMHGSKALLTDVLKQKMGFDGFVVTDWDGIGEVPGCRNDSCPQAINAGIDMVMVPDAWKAFISNTIAQVKSGEIPMSRIDDAVTRIIRVKLRAGLFGKKPSDNIYAGKQEALQDRELARQAVRESLVLLKNDSTTLPLARNKKILVVGKTADDISNQTGGWSLTWQGTDNKNTDFPNADSILTGIKAAVGEANVEFSADGKGVDVSRFDAVIAVIGETPYAEMYGDIGPAGTLRHSGSYPEDLAVLRAVAGKGKPVVTLFVSGRPLYVNDLMNLSDSFVAAWLPGSEGKGVADVLFRAADGKVAHDFKGTLSFSWPKSVCQTSLNFDEPNYSPLFKLGYGLNYSSKTKLGKLDSKYPSGGCGVTNAYPVFNQADRATYPLYVVSGTEQQAVGADLNRVLNMPGISVQTSQVNSQQDAKLVSWSAAARVEARAAHARALPAFASKDGALTFDTIVATAPAAPVSLSMHCGNNCVATLDVTDAFKRLAGKKEKQTVKIPLSCFVAKGVKLHHVDVPFSISTTSTFSAAFTNIQIVGGAAKDQDALNCTELK
ncbi:MAG: glycoside hydrolase family 3 N-terminal domain-containing protein [Undibacterium umbellatum]|uniref:glycoside hydrolase family 3 protein n=1 Tax=Undibacterium umbellatum TaxID=2762300 RepID=UPI003BB57B87